MARNKDFWLFCTILYQNPWYSLYFFIFIYFFIFFYFLYMYQVSYYFLRKSYPQVLVTYPQIVGFFCPFSLRKKLKNLTYELYPSVTAVFARTTAKRAMVQASCILLSQRCLPTPCSVVRLNPLKRPIKNL